ncbi:MAG: hypothetical protein WBA12_07020 [Catalinimonas sp.]
MLPWVRRTLLPAAVLVLLFVRLYRLAGGALWSYDAAANWDAARRIAAGDLSRMFTHAAPSTQFLFGGLATFLPHFYRHECINIAVGVAALLLWSRWCARRWGWSPAESAAWLLWTGTTFFLTATNREISGQMAALGLTAGALLALQRGHWTWAALLFGGAFTFYYMALTFLPVGLLLARERWHEHRLVGWAKLVGVGLLPPLLYVAVGTLAGLRWYHYPAGVVLWTFGRLLTPWLEPANVPDESYYSVSIFGNLGFYVRYLWSFEQPLLLLSVPVVAVAFRRMSWAGWAAAAYLLLMVLVLPRAPRVLLFVVPLTYGVAWVAWRRVLPRFSWVVPALGLCWNGWALVQWVYPYDTTSYDELADYLREQGIDRLVTTVGRGVEAFAPEVAVTAALDPETVGVQRALGVRYLLVDDYHRVAGVAGFGPYAAGREVWSAHEPSLLLPLLHLEHAEFADRSYREVMELHRTMRADTVHLRLIRLE